MGDIPRTPNREGIKSTAEDGYLHCGESGGGHFVKMVHNGIEYGMMARVRRGPRRMKAANVGKHAGEIDAETTPLRDPEHYMYDFDLTEVTEVWRRGSVIASWLLDLTASALAEDPALSKFGGRVSDSGEGRWTIKAGIDEGVPTHVLTASSVRTLQFARRGRLFQQAALRYALCLRGPSGEAGEVMEARQGAGQSRLLAGSQRFTVRRLSRCPCSRL